MLTVQEGDGGADRQGPWGSEQCSRRTKPGDRRGGSGKVLKKQRAARAVWKDEEGLMGAREAWVGLTEGAGVCDRGTWKRLVWEDS